jgi:hypothetical protein
MSQSDLDDGERWWEYQIRKANRGFHETGLSHAFPTSVCLPPALTLSSFYYASLLVVQTLPSFQILNSATDMVSWWAFLSSKLVAFISEMVSMPDLGAS